MPELPEVETVRRGLARLIIGKKISHISHDTPKSFPNADSDVEQFMYGATVTAVRRRAKVLLIDLSTDYTLVTHLKMTGQVVWVAGGVSDSKRMHTAIRHESSANKSLQPAELPSVGPADSSSAGQDLSAPASGNSSSVFVSESETHGTPGRGTELRWGAGHPNDSLVHELPDKSTRVIIEFDDKSHLYFNDQRKFGWMKLYPSLEVPEIDFMKKVGPEPLEDDFTAKEFTARFARRKNTSIKAALLDQTVIAGVGNIYADESLWGAKIDPRRKVGDVSSAEFKKLYTELRYVMNLAIEKGGSTDRNYVNAEGKKGSYMDFARVFRREKLACPRCGRTIQKIKHAGRGTHFCPYCQK